MASACTSGPHKPTTCHPRRTRSGFQSIQDYLNPLFQLVGQKLLVLALYAIQGVVTASLITFISLFIYLFLYRTYVPNPISRETIYFNFNHDPPIASVNLLQGENIGSHTYHPYPHISTPTPPPTPFDLSRLLKPDYKYNFDITVELAKSQRNYEIGKFVLSADFLDTTG
ncbi:hypothetical protein EON63_22390 [archaeon]|nr:MAG: hypothetical protein EON63_22390 [archaeon]